MEIARHFSRFYWLPSRLGLRHIFSARASWAHIIWRRFPFFRGGASNISARACGHLRTLCRISDDFLHGPDLRASAQSALVTDARHLSMACGSVDVVVATYICARCRCAAHLVERRAPKPIATTFVYIEPTASGPRVFTRMPRANTDRVWQRRALNTVRH